ncbi:MAG: hypothetical protein D6798_14425 [Deltaproteobacteria bacterium]|nr:MAG: hypothetical protein D6798_14425 [Deltaproteobacteria bacterium]
MMPEDSEQILPRLVQALEGVSRWRQEQEEAARARLARINDERQRLRADIEQLEREIETLGDLELKVQAELDELPRHVHQRTRAAVDEGINADAEVLAERDGLYAAALKAREDAVAELLADPDIARLVEEYEQFQQVEPTLANLPAGYRDAILAHHDSVQRRLQPVLEVAQAPLQPVDAERAAVTLVASLNPMEGSPEALALILPVPFDIYEDWTERNEDLAAVLSYRIIAATSAALAQVGVPDVAMQYTDYQGKLAVQVWFGDDAPQGDVREALDAQLEALADQAGELRAVGLDLYTAWLDPRVVTGEDDDDVQASDGAAWTPGDDEATEAPAGASADVPGDAHIESEA